MIHFQTEIENRVERLRVLRILLNVAYEKTMMAVEPKPSQNDTEAAKVQYATDWCNEFDRRIAHRLETMDISRDELIDVVGSIWR